MAPGTLDKGDGRPGVSQEFGAVAPGDVVGEVEDGQSAETGKGAPAHEGAGAPSRSAAVARAHW